MHFAAAATLTWILFASGPSPDSAGPQLRHAGTLTVCSYAHFAPISYSDGQGYEADLLRAVARHWAVHPRFVPIEKFDGIWLAPAGPEPGCDVAIGGISPTAERRAQGAVFGPGTASFAQSLLVRRSDFDSGRITGYRSFAGTAMAIGVVPGTTGESYARQRAAEAGLPETVFRSYPSEDDLLPALKSGVIDAIARGEIGNRYQQSLDPSLLTIDLRDFGESFAMALDPANPGLPDALARTLNEVRAGGALGYPEWLIDPHVFDAR
ncbi:MAG: amino acid ABC transporter substrate-binding protein [Mycobacterium sp.]|nr:amino acid ABC transporter substrate-binding protein [Mycobacterium sp.]